MASPNRLLRTSERSTFAGCRHRWFWSYEERLRPRKTASVMRFGTMAHRVLELRYPPGRKRGPASPLLWEQVWEEEEAASEDLGLWDEDGKVQDMAELGSVLFAAYDAHYGEDDEWEVLSAEQRFRVRIAPKLYVVGTIDGVWRHRPTKRLVFAEHKTSSEIWTNHLGLDEQASTYWTFGPEWLRKRRIIRKDDELSYVLYNFIRRAKPDDRPRNELGQALNQNGSVSMKQQAPLFARHPVYREEVSARNLRIRVLEQAKEMQMIRDGSLVPIKSPGRFNCPMCPFKDPCEQHEVGADYQLLLDTAFEEHDPYSTYELAREGK